MTTTPAATSTIFIWVPEELDGFDHDALIADLQERVDAVEGAYSYVDPDSGERVYPAVIVCDGYEAPGLYRRENGDDRFIRPAAVPSRLQDLMRDAMAAVCGV